VPTPAITLTATLQSWAGVNDAGAALEITLCGFGQTLPKVTGASMLAKIKTQVLATAGTISTVIYGNDVITPTGTYYSIAVIDDQKNVVQSGIYQLSGSGTQDLSSLTQLLAQP
jgi:hypothetical protein